MSTRTEITIEIDRWIVVNRSGNRKRGTLELPLTDPNGFDVDELADAELGEFTPEPGTFDTAER